MSTSTNSISKHVSTAILTVVVVLALLLVLDYSAAQWQSAPGIPPNNNVAAPINVGPQNQDKIGGRIGADQFIAFDRMRSNQYCDLNGNNCFASTEVGTGGGSTVPEPPTCTGDDALQWDGSNWNCAQNVLTTQYADCTVTNSFGWQSIVLHGEVTRYHQHNGGGGYLRIEQCVDGSIKYIGFSQSGT